MKVIKIIKILSFLVVISAGLISCLKKGDMNIDIDKTTANVVELQFIENGSGSTINSGMQYFSGGALTYPGDHEADTATYNVSLAGATTLGSDLMVTVAIDPSKVLDNLANDAIQYELMPDSLFHIVSTSGTIKAGERIVPLQIIFYPSKMDPTKSYMLPVKISDAGGQTISDNFSTIYFHVIGNPIAGSYTQEWLRWNNATGAGAPTFEDGGPAVFAPVNPTTISVNSLTGTKYLLSFTNTGGVLSDFSIKFDAQSVTDAGITISSGPSITLADPTTGKYEFTFGYLNSAGAARVIIDKFEK
jgi:hypothetical protein